QGKKIERIDPITGDVTPVAGNEAFGNPWVDWHDGVGSEAGFMGIGSMAGDGKFLYAIDTNHLLRRVDTATSTVETLAISQTLLDGGGPVPANFPGVPTAPLDTMGQIATREGQVYVIESWRPDQSAPAIWKYDPGSGAFEQVAANPDVFGAPYLAGGGTFPSLGFDREGAPLVTTGHAVAYPTII